MRLDAREELGLTNELRKLQDHEFDNEFNTQQNSRAGIVFYSILWSVVVSGMIFGLIFLSLSQIQINTIRIRGDLKLSKEQIINQIHLKLPERYFNVDTDQVKTSLENHPLIYNAQVSKTLTGKLDILLEKSYPLVTLLAKEKDKNIPVYIDKFGRCVQVGVGLGMVDVPVISGIKIVNPAVGLSLPIWAGELMKYLDTIRSENKKLYQQISEIHIIDEGQDYRILKINFIGLRASFITDINISPQLMMQIWQLANTFEKNQDDSMPEFEYFDIRQGVIIGKGKT